MGLAGDLSGDIESRLVLAVERGEVLDLTDRTVVAESAARTWRHVRPVSAELIRDILRPGRVRSVDPHGLRLRGARVVGRLDLENLATGIWIELYDCYLPEGVLARDASFPGLALFGCMLTHPNQPPLWADAIHCVNGISVIRTQVVAASADGALRLPGMAIGGTLNLSGSRVENQLGCAVDLYNARIEAAVFLVAGFQAIGAGSLGSVRLPGARIGGSLHIANATMRNKSGPALLADGIETVHDILLGGGFIAIGAGKEGAMRLPGARVGGMLRCFDTNLRNDSGPALVGGRLTVEHSVLLDDEVTAVGAGGEGAVRLPGARIGAVLDCSGFKISNPSGPALVADGLYVQADMILLGGFNAVGATAAVTVRLSGAVVDGALRLDLEGVTNTTNPRCRIALDRFVFRNIPESWSSSRWLAMLREATPTYAAQPYQQIAAVHRAAGHDSDVRRILIEQRRQQIRSEAIAGRGERTWARITGLTLGYGYQPWRALVGLFIVAVITVTLCVLASDNALSSERAVPITNDSCSLIQRVGLGLEIGLPLVGSATQNSCQFASTQAGETLTVLGWGLRTLGWAFATLFIAGFTGAVRKS